MKQHIQPMVLSPHFTQLTLRTLKRTFTRWRWVRVPSGFPLSLAPWPSSLHPFPLFCHFVDSSTLPPIWRLGGLCQWQKAAAPLPPIACVESLGNLVANDAKLFTEAGQRNEKRGFHSTSEIVFALTGSVVQCTTKILIRKYKGYRVGELWRK